MRVGYEPNAEKAAVAKVIAELENLDFAVDDTARRQASATTCLPGTAVKASSGGDRGQGFASRRWDPSRSEQNEWAQALQRGEDYWLYVVDDCAHQPTVRVRVKNPAQVFGEGAGRIQRVQIKLSQLSEQAKP